MMAEKFWLLLGAVEIILGGLMTAFPAYFPWYLSSLVIVIGIGTAIFAVKGLSNDIWNYLLQKARNEVQAKDTELRAPASNERDVNLREAIWRAFLGHWEEPAFDFQGLGRDVAQKFHDLAVDEFRQNAFEGKLPIWGINEKSGLWGLIPQSFWEDHQVDYIALFGEQNRAVLIHKNEPERASGWLSPMTNKVKVEELWPKGLHDQSKPYFMPIIKMREIIRKLQGWQLDDGGLQYLDLARAFRDAAYKEQFEVWGKKLPRNGMFRDEVISQEIPKIYWVDATLDMFTFPSETENEGIVTHIMDPSKREILPVYFDLEVEREKGIRWCKSDDAKKFRGQADAEKAKRHGE